jgi:hypothetical protein
LSFLSQTPERPSLETVLTRVEQYVADYEPRLSRCVATERYVQRVYQPSEQSRRLTSDFLFLRVGSVNSSWLGVRSVLDVDGKRQVTREDELRDIVRASPSEAVQLANAIASANADHNLGVVRTVNVPTYILGWLRADVRTRLRFAPPHVNELQGASWRLDFVEEARPTWIRSPEGQDLPSRGSIWVDPANGRILQTEVKTVAGAATAMIRVKYAMDPRLAIMVPVSMTETVEGLRRQRGEATYSDFRRFDVTSRIW